VQALRTRVRPKAALRAPAASGPNSRGKVHKIKPTLERRWHQQHWQHEVHQPVAPLPRSCRACAAGTAGGCCQSLSRPGHAGSGRCVRRAPLRRPQRATHVPRCARASASPLSTARPPPAAPPARPAAACQPAHRPACPPAHRPACLPACLGGGWPARRAAACLAPRADHLADIRLASTSTARRRAARRGLS